MTLTILTILLTTRIDSFLFFFVQCLAISELAAIFFPQFYGTLLVFYFFQACFSAAVLFLLSLIKDNLSIVTIRVLSSLMVLSVAEIGILVFFVTEKPTRDLRLDPEPIFLPPYTEADMHSREDLAASSMASLDEMASPSQLYEHVVNTENYEENV